MMVVASGYADIGGGMNAPPLSQLLLINRGVTTGGGGWHIYFAIAPATRYKNKPLAPGIDVRGYGGLVVAPPSLHQSGRNYAWMHGPDSAALAAIPPWLAALLQPPPPKLRPIPIAQLSHEHAIALIIEAASRTGLSRSEAQHTAQSAFQGVL